MGSTRANTSKPPVIVLGGDVNALSIARTLFKDGIEVYALNHAHRLLRFSRACRWIELSAVNSEPKDWEAFLLSPESDYLQGAVILACNDEAIEIVIRNAERLQIKYILEEVESEIRSCLLDKLSTYQLASQAGLPVPRHWQISSLADLEDLKEELVFPLILKPKHSHKFRRVWHNLKYFRADRMDEVYEYLDQAIKHDIEVVLMEFIPGGDDMDCSYYAYMGDNGAPLAELTKKCIRRHPPNMGSECFGVTDWNPEVRELGLSFFRYLKYKGVGQIQFKRDQRDGQLKLIEVNARFAAPTCLVAASGVDLAGVAYARLTGQKLINKGEPGSYVKDLRWWVPIDDFMAFVALKKSGKLNLGRWLADVCQPHVLPVFRWSDPLPSLVGLSRDIFGVLKKLVLFRS